ncbi:MAG: hypothetical protein R3C25_12625 [Hyphomonadaceae bacterium]
MAQSLAPSPPRAGQPATLEGVNSFRVRTAALARPAAPLRGDPNLVLLTSPDGGVVVYPPGGNLVILASRRA